MTTEDQNIGRLVIDRYRLDELLGRGGFGSVYKGWDAQIGRDVAVKLLDVSSQTRSPEQAAELRERFRREAMAAGRIDHPCVVTIFDFGIPEEGGEAFLVMELLEGCDLADELSMRGPLMPDRALRLFVSMLEALGRGHELGIVHKDIKPSNVFIRHAGESAEAMCLVDFGVARVMHEDKLTVTGLIVGTPQYMAPEYITDTIVSPALDVYQSGLILVEAITGVPAVPLGETFVKSCNRHFTGDLDVPDELYEGPFGAVLRKALAVDPDDRFEDGTEFAEALMRVDPGSISVDFQETMVFVRKETREETFDEPPLFPTMRPEQVSAELERAGHDSSALLKPDTPISVAQPNSNAIGQPEVDPFEETLSSESSVPVAAIRVSADAPARAGKEEGSRSPATRLGRFEAGAQEERSPDVPAIEPTPSAPERADDGVLMVAVAMVFIVVVVGAGLALLITSRDTNETTRETPVSEPAPRPSTPVEEPVVPPAVAAEREVLTLNSEPADAEVVVEGEVVGKTPHVVALDETDASSVDLRLEGYVPASVKLTAGERTIRLQPVPEEKEERPEQKPTRGEERPTGERSPVESAPEPPDPERETAVERSGEPSGEKAEVTGGRAFDPETGATIERSPDVGTAEESPRKPDSRKWAPKFQAE